MPAVIYKSAVQLTYVTVTPTSGITYGDSMASSSDAIQVQSPVETELNVTSTSTAAGSVLGLVVPPTNLLLVDYPVIMLTEMLTASVVDDQLAQQTGQMHISPVGSDEIQENQGLGLGSGTQKAEETTVSDVYGDTVTTQSGV